MAFELRVECPACRVEGALVETWDAEEPPCRLGLPLKVHCRVCGLDAEGVVAATVSSIAPGDGCPSCGSTLTDDIRNAHRCPYCGSHAEMVDRTSTRTPGSEEELRAALDVWARAEGLANAQELIETYFVLPTVREVFAALGRKEPLETTFDVADYLFSSGGGAGGAASGEKAVMREPEEEAPSTLRMPKPASVRKVGGPRDELLAIASIAAADGDASADDQAILLRAATQRQVVPLAPEDVRVWRPNELDPPATLPDRERVLEEMFQMAFADGQMDESELRLIKDYARAWGVDPQRVAELRETYDFAKSGRFMRWLERIGFFLFPSR